MTLMQKFLGAAAGLALTAGAAFAEPALVYDLGGKFDKSFNEAAFAGAQRWAEETGGTFREIEMQSEAQREQALRRFAESGANPVITTGFAFSSALEVVAPDYPDTTFVTIDGWVDAPNVKVIGFTEHEGSYLVGMLAAEASKTGTVGFIGGMDIPLIRKFACGYAQGVKAVNPDATIISNMTGTTPAAWNDPVKGSELTKAQISQGADVVYAAAAWHRRGRSANRRRRRHPVHRRRQQPEPPAPRQGPDIDAETRGRGRIRVDEGGRRSGRWGSDSGSGQRRRRLCDG